MTNIEKIRIKSEKIMEIVDYLISNNIVVCEDENHRHKFLYSREREIGVDIEFFYEPSIVDNRGVITTVLGKASAEYKKKGGCVHLNMYRFNDDKFPYEEKLKVIDHELGHIREIRLFDNHTEEAAVRYERESIINRRAS